MRNLIVACADIGSVAKGNFGWWASSGGSGMDLSGLTSLVAQSLNDGVPVALGFECPLFVPLVEDERLLTSARPGEGSRAWSAGAGCGALTTGLVQVTWALRSIRHILAQSTTAHLVWEKFASAQTGLFLWEAFVSGSGKKNSHIADAQAGAMAFLDALPNPQLANAVSSTSSVYSLVGAALLRTGWSSDLAILGHPCLVVKSNSNAA